MRKTLLVKWVLERMYNHYNGLTDLKKQRPVLVWQTDSKLFKGRSLCFYCSTKIDWFNLEACVPISKTKNPAFNQDGYVWTHKPIFVKKHHFTKYKQTISEKIQGIRLFDNHTDIIDPETIIQISEKIKLFNQDLTE